jgi:quinone-modifying oxidoreductase subunit QmoC
MADSYLVDPDVGFIEEVSRLGGADVKKCYQCATCAVACPISPDSKPFPRKEMIAASWGLKDRLIGNGDIWLCHNCGDCTSLCPRGAKPGDVLAALRSVAVTEYATPKSLAKMVSDPKKLPILLAIPAVIFLVVGLLLKMVGVDWLNFAPTGDHLWGSSYINNYLVDIIMIPTFTAAIVIFGLGLKRFIAAIHANALAEGKTDQEKIDPVVFIQSLVKTIPTILKHNKFNECGDNADRATPHMMVFFGFLALFIVTACFFLAEWVFHIEGPYSQINPIKWLGNLGGLGVIIGGLLLLKKRISDEATTYWDWYLVGLVLALGITGLFTELLRLGGAFGVMAIVYYIHLILVWSLFAYTPFSKLAHIVYRTVAMSYQEYSGRK